MTACLLLVVFFILRLESFRCNVRFITWMSSLSKPQRFVEHMRSNTAVETYIQTAYNKISFAGEDSEN